MSSVKITWSEQTTKKSYVPESTIQYLNDEGFYAIYIGVDSDKPGHVTLKKLLYIGQAYDQTIRKRIQQPHDADECIDKEKKKVPGADLYVKAGIITEKDQETTTPELINDIECCMINKNQPECNQQCRESYEGREIRITHANAKLITDSTCKPS